MTIPSYSAYLSLAHAHVWSYVSIHIANVTEEQGHQRLVPSGSGQGTWAPAAASLESQ